MYDNIIPLQLDFQEKKNDYALATVIKTSGSSIAKPGFKILAVNGKIVYGTLGSPSLDNVVLKESEISIKNKETKYLKIALDKDNRTSDYSMNTTCGGMIELFIEPYVHRRNIVMLVESNEDKLLGVLEGLIPYIDMNPLVVNINRDEEVKRLLSENHSDDYVVLLTKTENEIRFISHFLKEKPRYLSIVSSKNRFNKDLEQVKKNDPELDTSLIKCPAGVDINAITINEIALSIVAEIIREKNLSDKQ
jgi:xanthine dehydrogenase accessory factor